MAVSVGAGAAAGAGAEEESVPLPAGAEVPLRSRGGFGALAAACLFAVGGAAFASLLAPA